MVEKPKQSLESSGKACRLSIDLSKPYDSLKYYHLIAKLTAYCFDDHTLSFIHNFLWDGAYMSKVNNTCTLTLYMVFQKPQY